MSSGSCIKEYLGILSSADNPTPAGRAGAFLELSSKGGGSGKVQMLFDVVARRLRRQVLEGVARERHGSEGVRVVRLLMDTGKLDEKQVCIYICLQCSSSRTHLDIQTGYDAFERRPTSPFGPIRVLARQHRRSSQIRRSQSHTDVLPMAGRYTEGLFIHP